MTSGSRPHSRFSVPEYEGDAVFQDKNFLCRKFLGILSLIFPLHLCLLRKSGVGFCRQRRRSKRLIPRNVLPVNPRRLWVYNKILPDALLSQSAPDFYNLADFSPIKPSDIFCRQCWAVFVPIFPRRHIFRIQLLALRLLLLLFYKIQPRHT